MGQGGNRPDGFDLRDDFTPSVVRWRENNAKIYSKVKRNPETITSSVAHVTTFLKTGLYLGLLCCKTFGSSRH